jgi:hypothetical protein
MIELIFRRKSRTLTYPMPQGPIMIEAFSEVRNELNGQRPDLSRLPDVETGCNQDRSPGPVVMPRVFPLGTFNVLGVEATDNQWMEPFKIITDAHQPVPIYTTKPDGTYGEPTGEWFDDWCYWVHFANGSGHTDGCTGIVQKPDLLDLAQAVKNALDSGIPVVITCLDE